MDNNSPVAVISGGSSGIGLAIARLLIERGYRVILMARDKKKLEAAKTLLDTPGHQAAQWLCVDVTDAQATEVAIKDIIHRFERIDWVIASAGVVEPALFEDASLGDHHRQMDVNYFGSLNVIKPALPTMMQAGSGYITLISSAASFVGIAGYSGYAASKFAVRALGEVLNVELAHKNIHVSVACPPDTDTPQLAYDNAHKPTITRRISDSGGMLKAEDVARDIVEKTLSGRFLITSGFIIKLYSMIYSLYAPFFRRRQKFMMK